MDVVDRGAIEAFTRVVNGIILMVFDFLYEDAFHCICGGLDIYDKFLSEVRWSYQRILCE